MKPPKFYIVGWDEIRGIPVYYNSELICPLSDEPGIWSGHRDDANGFDTEDEALQVAEKRELTGYTIELRT